MVRVRRRHADQVKAMQGEIDRGADKALQFDVVSRQNQKLSSQLRCAKYDTKCDTKLAPCEWQICDQEL